MLDNPPFWIVATIYSGTVYYGFVKMRGDVREIRSWRAVAFGHCCFLAVLLCGYKFKQYLILRLPDWYTTEAIPMNHLGVVKDSVLDLVFLCGLAILFIVEVRWVMFQQKTYDR